MIELGDLEPDWAGDHFDGALEAAVNRFQHRHGIQEDGVVGADTLAALNVSPQRRVDQIEANMERWRWLPQDLGSEYILVNIASFELTVHTENGEAMRQPVVVGRPYRRTPVFSHRMTYVVLNPSWEMPHRLASLDQLPLIRRDPDYLERMGITVLRGWGAAEEVIDPASVDWATLNPRTFPYRLRQRPGPLNALGEVKFMFPNSHAIYLHDTPHQGIFASADRAVSSGCIRLSDPVALLRWLLAERPDAPQMTPEDIGTMLEEGEETTVLLRQAIPIHLLYWTAWVGADDRLHYTRDIYQRDAPVLEALRASAPATPVHASPTF
ncbi:MAG: L,D-transpeptidase family protein [Gammaproteobacteria bacterium]|nr:L,D-transpeptidase family protein [Gammaproteobacteria bacterium]